MRPLGLLCAAASLALTTGAAFAEAPAADRATQLWEAGDEAGAVAEWDRRAKAGDLDAMYNLGQAYRAGKGVPQSMPRATEYYRAAAMGGHKPAAEQLGLIYYDDPKTRRAAVNLLLALANEGRPRSAYVIGLEYMAGEILPRDPERARYYLEIASKGGVKLADTQLVRMAPPRVAASVQVPATVPQIQPSPASLPTRLGAAASSSSSAWSAPVAASAATRPAPTVGSPTASNAPPITTGRWGVWFGPYRDNVTAGIKFARISARAKFEGEAKFVRTPGGVQVVYGELANADASAFCDRLNKGRYQCRGVIDLDRLSNASAPVESREARTDGEAEHGR